jgi:hypothetical protein
MSESTCSVDGCDREHAARGWCLMHYRRASKRGWSLSPRACSVCGTDISDRKSDALVCSKQCGFKASYAGRRVDLIAYQRANYRDNRATILARQRIYVKGHADEARRRGTEWARRNHVRVALSGHRHRALRRNATSGGFTSLNGTGSGLSADRPDGARTVTCRCPGQRSNTLSLSVEEVVIT